MPLIRRTPELAPSPPPATDPFALLTNADPDRRWEAARALAALPGGVAALAQAIPAEFDVRVRSAMLTALARAGTPDAVTTLLKHVRADDAGLRGGALDALRAMPGATQSFLPELLADADADVRLLACEIVRVLPPGAATTLLIPLLGREQQANVCAAAVDVLAEIGEPAAVPALRQCGARFAGEKFLNFAIAHAIERLRAETDPA